MISFTNDLAPEEYLHLREAVGWARLSQGQAERGLQNAAYVISARDGNTAVGMARVLFDFGYTAYIHDVIVLPEYQRQGIGTQLMNNVLDWLKANSYEDDFMQYVVVSAKGKESWYERFGFVARPTDTLGAGMTLRNGDA